MAEKVRRKIVLDDGTFYEGYGFGENVDRVCEVVFNTSMVGYQEILSDPSCTDQLVVMTYPLIGNYGIADEDYETKTPTIGGLIVREYNDQPSNFRYTKTLSEVMEEYHIPGIYGLDTRKLTRAIRDGGNRRALLTAIDTPIERAMEIIHATPVRNDQISRVSCKKRWYSKTANARFNVVAVDCGIMQSMVRSLNARRCNVTVVPWNTTAEAIEQMHPDGVFFSNGPGNPDDAGCVIELIKQLRGKMPMLGICLGHLLISRAYGAEIYKLKFGHFGGNHPVKNLITGKVETVSQGHNYAVDAESLKNTDLELTHVNLLDRTVEGVRSKTDKVFSVQYHPESAPGHHDSSYIYDQFIAMMEEERKNA